MNIELVHEQDSEDIFRMITDCVNHLKSKRIYQWNENYPTVGIIADDIRNNYLYGIKKNNKCITIIVINENQESEWKTVSWSDESRNPLIIHRLIVDPIWQNKGIGKILMEVAVKYAKNNNYDSIRFDAYSGNIDLIKLYERIGCRKRGEVYFANRELPFYCYEYRIHNDTDEPHHEIRAREDLLC